MRHLYTLLLCLLLSKNSFTQQQFNLVPNWSFEDSVICPSNITGVSIPNPWYFPSKFECKKNGGYYCNRCSQVNWASVPYNYDSSIYPSSSYQETKTGDGYVVLPTYKGWLYLQTALKKKLLATKKYWCNYWVSTINISKYSSNNLGILFTNTPVYADTTGINYCNGLLAANPQIVSYGNPIINDTLNWVSICGIYTATGGEKYITLGNFKPDNLTQAMVANNTIYAFDAAGYYVDDISVIPLDSFCLKADAGKDKAITLGDSVFIGSLTNGIDSLKWQILNTSNIIDSIRPGFWVHPTVTTSYVLQQVVNGCFSADTVVVTVGTVPLTMMNYELRMMNAKQIENRWVTANEINVSHFNIQRSFNGRDFINNGQVKAKNKSYNEYSFIDGGSAPSPFGEGWGEAFYRIESVDLDGRKQYSQTLNLKPQTLNSISVYPNPAKEQITVTCKGAKGLMIIDYLGRVVYQLNNITVHQTINTKQFTKGLYLLQVKTISNEVYNKKLLVE
jgi:hypothetical protein